MVIDLCCATRRGLLVLEALAGLLPPDARLRVYSFREEPVEPPFLDAIREAALAHGAGFTETRKPNPAEPADLMFCCNWRHMIPPAVYSRCRTGAYIFHDSLLPRYRGFSPTVWAVRNGERETGVTLFEIGETVDSGRVVMQKAVPIGADEFIGSVVEHVTEAYLGVLRSAFPALLSGNPPLTVQDESAATYCCKLLPENAAIEWRDSTRVIYNRVRAFSAPYFGASTTIGGRVLRIWKAGIPENPLSYAGRIPGRVIRIDNGRDGSVEVLTGDGILRLDEVQLENEPAAPASAVITSLWTTLGR